MKTGSIASRRAFLRTAGASLTGSLAVVAGSTARASVEPALAEGRSRAEAEAHSPQTLHRAYIEHVNAGAFDALVDLFAPHAEVRFSGGVFVGRDQGIRRLYTGHFRQLVRAEPAHELLLEHPWRKHAVVLAADGASAAARFHCLVRARASLAHDLPLIQMARQQGQASIEWWEAGCFESAYVMTSGRWRIAELCYRTLGTAAALVPRARSKPAFVPSFSIPYPRDPLGPDRLERQRL